MELITVTPDTLIDGIPVIILISSNQISRIKKFLLTDCRLVLNHDVIQLLKSKYTYSQFHRMTYPIAKRKEELRNHLIRFDRRRKQRLDYVEYLEQNFLEKYEPDIITCDLNIELRFGF